MSWIIKLKDKCYIEYNKKTETFDSNVLAKDEVLLLLKADAEKRKLSKTTLDVDKDVKNMFDFIEQNGTSDLHRGVNLKFVLKYNESGVDGKPLSLEEILSIYTKSSK